MASAATKSKTDTAVPGKPEPLPTGFVSPFKRVPMEGRVDDALACIAILTGHTLAQVTEEAIAIGYPAHGPAFPTEAQIAMLCMKLGGLVATKYKEFKTWLALPEVALVYVDWSDDMEVGRHIVCHAVRATEDRKAFRYLIDPAHWLPAERHFTTSLELVEPDYFIGISKANTTAIKGGKV
ncbi:MAG: hypothetical protein EOO27_22000 [Comamonadaceae bacterium]|nr:MAG: hypothetical protein EOO27_22000 [Comamonadaceae bacterium]